MFPLERHLIFFALAGSQAHGTAREGSDVDLRGVCVAPLDVRLSLFESFEQHEGLLEGDLEGIVRPRLATHPTARHAARTKVELVVFDVAKFLRLCAAANPNALEMLFTDEGDWLLATPAWQRLHQERHRFLTKKVQQTFLGYAMAQLKKIKTHRSWLLSPPTGEPRREDFGLPAATGTLSADDQSRIERSITERLRSYGVDDIEMPPATRIAVEERLRAAYRDRLEEAETDVEDEMRRVAVHALRLDAEVVVTLEAERRYRAARKQWDSYRVWMRQRNPARAALERVHGYDTKHAMHLVRLLRMGLEIVERGECFVRRADAAELAAIRDGSLSFDALLAVAAALQAEVARVASHSPLPDDDVDLAYVDELARGLMMLGA